MEKVTWQAIPFVRFLIPLILGIICSTFIDIQIELASILIFIGVVWLVFIHSVRKVDLRMKMEKTSVLPVFIVLFGLAGILVNLNTSITREDHFSNFQNAEYLIGRVTESTQEKKNSIKAVLKVKNVGEAEKWSTTSGKLLVYFEKGTEASHLEIGDELILKNNFNEVKPPANPGEFNYKRFLSFRDLYHQQYVLTKDWSRFDTHWSPRKQAERWRQFLRAQLDRVAMGQNEEAIASALLLGKKDELGPELIKSYASAGAMHVLAVSGLHVGIIFFILRFLFSFLERMKHGALLKNIVLIACLWIYAFITGLSPSVVRASTMFTAVAIGQGLNRKNNMYNTIASSAFVLLLFNPFYLMEVGFQLSYLAVLGIIYLHPKIYALLYFPRMIPDKLWQITCVSIAAQLATFPLGLLYFHQFPTYFLLSNLLVIPAAFIILYIGVSYFVLFWIPLIGDWVGALLKWTILYLNKGVAWVESLPYSLIQGIDISILETWLIYLATASLIFSFSFRKKMLFKLAILAIALLCLNQVGEILTFKRHPHLVVYDVRGQSVVNILSNQKNLMFCDNELAEDMDKQQFHLRNNWNKHDAPEPHFLSTDNVAPLIALSSNCFGVEGNTVYRIAEVDHVPDINSPIELDYVILSYFKNMDAQKIFHNLHPRNVILDGTIKLSEVDDIIRHIPQNMRVHSVARDGYFSEAI